jgi:hypothetical protein
MEKSAALQHVTDGGYYLRLPACRSHCSTKRSDKLHSTEGHVEEDCCERIEAKALDNQRSESADACWEWVTKSA